MTHTKTEVTNLQYNAATQSFEALVLVHTLSGPVTYATTAYGSMNTDFTDISKTLAEQALSRHGTAKSGLRSRMANHTTVRRENEKIKTLLSRLLTTLPLSKAA